LKKISIILLFAIGVTCFSFFTKKIDTAEQETKNFYKIQTAVFVKEIVELQVQIENGNGKKIQNQFLKTRAAYKQIEVFTEYFFAYYATKLNGPPIIFFEDSEPDKGEQKPTGMQVAEGLIFPGFNTVNKNELQKVVSNLLADTKYMQATNESFAFNDEYIFDAVSEQLFRITALGLSGFDAQLSENAMPECAASLLSLQKILTFYKQDIDKISIDKFSELQKLLFNSETYLTQHKNFIKFDRMHFIMEYLNPITKIIGAYKQKKGFTQNNSAMFYSTVKKNNTLFDQNIFDVNKYLDDNTTSPEKIELGRKLFYDNQLSKDNNRSCASCHNPNTAFVDGLVTSKTIEGHGNLRRNTPTLWNAALQRNLFFDSRSKSLEDQVMQVLNSANEMNGSAEKAAEKIITQKEYQTIYAKVYPPNVNYSAAQNICNAIACYERTLVALNSKFDKHIRGEAKMHKNEIDGFNLFMGKAKCGTCHFMPLFSGSKPPRYYFIESEVIGVPANTSKAKSMLDTDEGRFVQTKLPLHKYSFKTSTLRNIALTAPYMHNGVYNTLQEVITFYNNGGGQGLNIAPPNQTLPFDKLNLTPKEQKNIISFLKTLTDTSSSN
jgi:cytochrome c peroxidase